MNTPVRTVPYRSKRGLLGALFALIAGGMSQEYAEKQVKLAGYRHGKHCGRHPGSFGRTAAKRHRVLYLRPPGVAHVNG